MYFVVSIVTLFCVSVVEPNDIRRSSHDWLNSVMLALFICLCVCVIASQGEVKALKAEGNELADKAANEKFALATAQQEQKSLKSQIVHSPARLQRSLQDLTNQVHHSHKSRSLYNQKLWSRNCSRCKCRISQYAFPTVFVRYNPGVLTSRSPSYSARKQSICTCLKCIHFLHAPKGMDILERTLRKFQCSSLVISL